jgi:hypothetical protein
LEDELRIKSDLIKGKVKIASAQQPGTVIQPQQPAMQIQIQQNLPQVVVPQTGTPQVGVQPGAQPGALAGGQQVGSLIVIIAPQIIAQSGVRWKVGGGQWMKSGETVSNLAPGIYTVEFQEVVKYIKPENQMVLIESGQTITLNGIYNSK